MSTENKAPAQRTLKRDPSILLEFNASDDPNCLALYFHLKDSQFDAFNASEYHSQLLKYFENKMNIVEVVSRTIQGKEYLLVCLRDPIEARNGLCELAFLCQRQFQGISMLVKRHCFICNKPTNKKCGTCKVACFCSKECLEKGWGTHKKVCNHVKKCDVPVVEKEDEKLELI